MSAPLALVYPISLARSHKWEAEYFGTMRVIPPAGDVSFTPDEASFADGYALGVNAIRNLDPEVGRMIVTPNGRPEALPFDSGLENSPPAFEKDGWRVFIEWEAL